MKTSISLTWQRLGSTPSYFDLLSSKLGKPISWNDQNLSALVHVGFEDLKPGCWQYLQELLINHLECINSNSSLYFTLPKVQFDLHEKITGSKSIFFTGLLWSRRQKANFLQALKIRMEALRARGREIILLGDLNISPAPLDSCEPGFTSLLFSLHQLLSCLWRYLNLARKSVSQIDQISKIEAILRLSFAIEKQIFIWFENLSAYFDLFSCAEQQYNLMEKNLKRL